MKKAPLSIAVVAAIFATATMATTLPTHSVPSFDFGQDVASKQDTLDVRYVRMSELATALTSTGLHPARWSTSNDLKGRSIEDAARDADPIVAWVPASALATANARSEAAHIVRSGIAFLVTGTSDEPRHESKVFGVRVPGTAALYQVLPDGTMDIHASASTAAAPLAAWHALTNQALESRRAAASKAIAAGDDNPQGPFRRYNVWMTSPTGNGSALRMEIIVMRDSNAGNDKKIVSIKSSAAAHPFRNGLTDTPWYIADLMGATFKYEGFAQRLYTATQYSLETRIDWPADASPELVTTYHYPAATSATDISFTDSQETTTSFNWGISAELGADLAAAGIEAIGKLAPKVGGGAKSVSVKSMGMTLKDYSTEVMRSNGKNHASVVWVHPLLGSIKSNKRYFDKKDAGRLDQVEALKLTPMMKSAGLEGYSQWSMKGDYEGEITIASAAIVNTGVWNAEAYNNGDTFFYRDKALPGQDALIPKDPLWPDVSQPVGRIVIDLSAPQITRLPTVLLQSMALNDGCLTQANPTQPLLSMTRCDASDMNLSQQWQLDELKRYVNRGSKMCLTADASGRAMASECSTSRAQTWEWRADRIHSTMDAGRPRLYVGEWSSPRAGFDASLHEVLPVNTTHELLPPWNNYPLPTFKGDFVQGFLRPSPVPEEYLKYRAIGTGERWMTIPLIYGLN